MTTPVSEVEEMVSDPTEEEGEVVIDQAVNSTTQSYAFLFFWFIFSFVLILCYLSLILFAFTQKIKT